MHKTAAAYDELKNLTAQIESIRVSEENSPIDLQTEIHDAVTDRENSDPQPQKKYKDGTYSGSANGNHGTGKDIEVEVTIEDDRIISVIITGFRDDKEYYSPDIEGSSMIENIITKQSPYVDIITGATESSEGLINAVKDALNQARK